MSKVSICTFNMQNLFGRYRVFTEPAGSQTLDDVMTTDELLEGGGFLPGQLFAPKGSFELYDKDEWRLLTAQALKGNTDNYPDIACFQEVENIRVLRKFNKDFLGKVYPHTLLIDSTDPRLIDVGVLSKYEIRDVRTHMDEPYSDRSGHLFTRDCLEVTFDVNGKPLTLFVNHLKSKWAKSVAAKARAAKKRKAQAERVAEIVRDRFNGSWFDNRAFAVVGDFNDTPDSQYLKPLVKDLGLENAIERISDKKKQWTYWLDKKSTVSQIDYILLSPRLSNSSSREPYIERRGISTKKNKAYLQKPDESRGEEIDFQFQRFNEMAGELEASDHCPVFFEVSL